MPLIGLELMSQCNRAGKDFIVCSFHPRTEIDRPDKLELYRQYGCECSSHSSDLRMILGKEGRLQVLSMLMQALCCIGQSRYLKEAFCTRMLVEHIRRTAYDGKVQG